MTQSWFNNGNDTSYSAYSTQTMCCAYGIRAIPDELCGSCAVESKVLYAKCFAFICVQTRISRSLGETIWILSEIKTREFRFVLAGLDLFSENAGVCFQIIFNLFLESRTFLASPHACIQALSSGKTNNAIDHYLSLYIAIGHYLCNKCNNCIMASIPYPPYL